MAYRTLRQGAVEASVPEQREDYIDYESTPQRRLIANLIALGVPVGGLTAAGTRSLFMSQLPRIKSAEGVWRTAALPGQRLAAESIGPMVGTGTGTGASLIASGVQGNDVRPNSAAIVDRGYEGDSPRERIAVTTANDILARQREAADSGLLDRANFHDEDAIPNPQRARMPIPPRRPASLDQTPAQQPQQGGFFSKMFKDPYAGMSARDLWSEYNKSQDPAMFVRADKAMMAEKAAADKAAAESDTGKAKGGAVAGKDAAIHKALEIIHHLLTRGH